MSVINWTGMTPEDIFASLAGAPRICRWEGESGVAFDPQGHQVACVLSEQAREARAYLRIPDGPRTGFYVSYEVAEAQLRADGFVIVNPRAPH